MDVAIRKAQLDDIAQLMEWRMRVLREVFDIPDNADTEALREANLAYYKQELSSGAHVACFAEDAQTGDVVGCGGICYQREMPSPDNPQGTCGYLMNIFTMPECRHSGVGHKIVQFLIKDAQQRKVGKIYLEATEAGKPVYRELGFVDMEGYMKLKTDISDMPYIPDIQ